ncbi:beta-lactamase family protein [Xanthomonas campestris pv. badrii]|uniref:Beta-lactamase family protein n=1 Tax=Xanthomonas campestris pv. badrii TaxID=149696 RepID=A0A7Z2VDM2_XANCA|nr:serine hydrolase domain-containing protein [Xanthomonas campestris]QJD69647.1 beta-lactamase family protein [Xanthomonas campestris pv. badrii]
MRAARAIGPYACLAASLALAWIGDALAADAPVAASAPSSFERRIEQRMQEAGVVGMGAAIIRDRRVVWSAGFGFADRARKLAFTPDTVMNIGSVSKTVTGVALMQAVQDGRLQLDADINPYLPFAVRNPQFPQVPITLRQLATHTSSLTDRWEVYRDTYRWEGATAEPLPDFLRGYLAPGGRDYLPQNYLPNRPGTHREYSNIGAGLVGYIVERAGGQPFEAYTRERIFAPLGMQRTAWHVAELPAGTHAMLYVGHMGLSVPVQPYELVTYPDGGLRSCVNDLSRLFIALLDGGRYQGTRVLDAATTAEMLRFQYAGSNVPDNVIVSEKNAGIFWSTKFNVTRIGHGGSDPGVRAEMLSDLDHANAVVMLSNTSLDGSDAKLQVELYDMLWAHALELRAQAEAAR